MKPIRVAVLAERLGTSAGGTEVYERCLLNALHSEAQKAGDMEIVPVLAWKRAADFLDRSLLPSCHFLSPEGKLGTLLTAGPVMRMLRPDVVHCCFVVPPLLGRLPVIATVHDLGFVFRKEHYPGLLCARLSAALRHTVNRADKVVCVSESTRKDLLLATDYPMERAETVYNGLDDRFLVHDGGHDVSETLKHHGIRGPYILYAGKLEPRKNVALLVEAYDRLRHSRRFDGQLVLLGSPKTFMWETTQQRIDRSVFHDDIVQTGFVPDDDLPAIYAGAGVMAFLSLYEGFGFPVIEAMASSVPVVCSNQTCLPEIAGDAALLVDPEDPEMIAQALDTALHNHPTRQKLVSKGLQRADHFTWEIAAKRMLSLYRDLAGYPSIAASRTGDA